MSLAISTFAIPSGTSIKNLDREAWLADRKNGIGASEIADICGFGYCSPLSVYLRKVCLLPPRE